MKCNKDFIVAYNELFKYLRERGGHQAVTDFWALLGDAILGRFRYLAKTKGIAGLLEYWSDTLSSEGAICSMHVDFEKDSSSMYIRMYECPSLKKMREEGIEPYEHYCDHCKILYGKALEESGFSFGINKKRQGCEIWIKKDLSCSEQADTPTPAST